MIRTLKDRVNAPGERTWSLSIQCAQEIPVAHEERRDVLLGNEIEAAYVAVERIADGCVLRRRQDYLGWQNNYLLIHAPTVGARKAASDLLVGRFGFSQAEAWDAVC